MDKIDLLKQRLIDAFSAFVRKGQRGYFLEGYDLIKDAMIMINMLENYVVDTNKTTALVNYYLLQLNKIQ